MLDKVDKALLREMQIDSNKKISELAILLGVPRTTVHNRIKQLEKQGYIKGYKALVDTAKIGKGLTVLMGIVTGMEVGSRAIAQKVIKMPQIEEIYIVAGQYDIIAKLRLRSTEDLAKLVFDVDSGLRNMHGITKTESMIVLETSKESGVIDPV